MAFKLEISKIKIKVLRFISIGLLLFLSIWKVSASMGAIPNNLNLSNIWHLLVLMLVVLFIFIQRQRLQSKKYLNNFCSIIIWGLVLSSFFNQYGNKFRRYLDGEYVRKWHVYHYYLGAKYFNELGYHDLYEQTLAADSESSRKLLRIQIIRDLKTLRKIYISPFQFKRSSSFSDSRWNDFKRDVEYFTELSSLRHFKMMLKDRGYNPSPFWTFWASGLANQIDIGNKLQRSIFLFTDQIIGVLAISIAVWAFSFRTIGIVLLLFIVSPLSTSRIIGGMLSYDWFYFLVIGLSLLYKRRMVSSAFFFAFSAMSRIFPFVFVAGILFSAFWRFTSKGSINGRLMSYAIAFVIFCSSAFLIGCLNDHGTKSWTLFYSNILKHNEFHVFGNRRIGLKHIFTKDLANLKRIENIDSKRESLERQMPYVYIFQGFFVLTCLLILINKKNIEASIWTLPILFVLVVSSRYYWAVFSLLPLLDFKSPDSLPSKSVSAISVVLLWNFIILSGKAPFISYVMINATILVFFSVMLVFESIRIKNRGKGLIQQ